MSGERSSVWRSNSARGGYIMPVCSSTADSRFKCLPARYRLDLMSESISRKEVVHVANLARLSLSSEEELLYTEQLGAILDHARDIMALKTEDLPPTAHPLELKNVFRPDVVTPSVDREEVLSQAPASQDGKFLVPRILGEAP